MDILQQFVDNFTYLGVFAVLLLGSLGVPIPEEMPIIAAAVLSYEGVVRWWLALSVCLLGVLSGDMVLYWAGRHWGEQLLNWRIVRLVLSPARAKWLKAAYRRHALKTVVTARHVVGLRAAAFLTAGIARVPFWKFVVADAGAAVLGVPLGFGLAYFFTDRIKAILADVHRVERWLGLAGLLVLAVVLVVAVWRWNHRVGKEYPLGEPAEGHAALTRSAKDGGASAGACDSALGSLRLRPRRGANTASGRRVTVPAFHLEAVGVPRRDARAQSAAQPRPRIFDGKRCDRERDDCQDHPPG